MYIHCSGPTIGIMKDVGDWNTQRYCPDSSYYKAECKIAEKLVKWFLDFWPKFRYSTVISIGDKKCSIFDNNVDLWPKF